MSSRALRKAQRQRGEDSVKLEQGNNSAEEELSEDHLDSREAQTKPNLFAMLGEDDTDDEGDVQEEQVDRLPEHETTEKGSAPKPSMFKSKKKKRKKGKGKSLAAVTTSTTMSEEFDEIDKALQSLDLTNTASAGSSNQAWVHSQPDKNGESLCKILAIDTQNLNASNEMRRLFGRVVVATETDDHRPAAGGRRRGRAAGFTGVLAGQHGPGARGGLGHRKNVFIQGKDTWPQATAGGLGMEVVEKNADGTILYSFVHNVAYQDVQRQFYICVASFDPERMVQLLVHNPYHIKTLLQVHEIAAAERDHSMAGELLERALFSFGRSVHSTFAASLAHGKARIDFNWTENRELWLTVWKYIKNLERRGTWRTAFEWAKLLFGLSPLDDPYCIGLIIDQLALRARMWEEVLRLTEDPTLQGQWSSYPNMSFSVALAYDKFGQPDLARSSLARAITDFPWIIPRLFQELNIERIPSKLWGREPPTKLQQLLTEMYVVRSKDIWNTPEATSLLVEVANCASDPVAAPHQDPFISLNQARHVILDDTPQFLSILPKYFTDPATSPLDPFPPAGAAIAAPDSGAYRELINLTTFFTGLGFGEGANLPDGFPDRLESRLDELISDTGVDEAILRSRLARLADLTRYNSFVFQNECMHPIPEIEHSPQEEKTSYLAYPLSQIFINVVVWHGADIERWEEGFDTSPLSQYASLLLKQKPEFAKRQIEAMEERFPGKGRGLLEYFIDLERPKQEEP